MHSYVPCSEMEACVSQFSHVIAIGAEKWADAANLLCPITRAKGKKVNLEPLPLYIHVHVHIHVHVCMLQHTCRRRSWGWGQG